LALDRVGYEEQESGSWSAHLQSDEERGFPRGRIVVKGQAFAVSELGPAPAFPASLRSLCVSASVERISPSSFQDCGLLENIAFEYGSRLNCIEKQAFSECLCLKSMAIPPLVYSLGKWGFAGCSHMGAISFSVASKLERIDEEAFSHCSSLAAIRIPAPLKFLDASGTMSTLTLSGIF
jgi:hypothetical protein